MVAVVIPIRPGDTNPELRYTLRSIAAHVPDPDIWVVGYRPSWLHGVHWIPTTTTGAKPDRGCQQTRAAADHPGVPEAFWWWDDDMFALAPVAIDHWHGGPVSVWLDGLYRDIDSPYVRALRRTVDLQLDGDETAFFYDLHVPFWVDDKAALAATMSGMPDGRAGWLWRTVHGNRRRYGGQQIPDVKVYRHDLIPDPPGPWLSCEDAALPRLVALLDDRFPDPSPWEGPATLPTGVRARYLHPSGQERTIAYRPAHDRSYQAIGWQLVELLPDDDVHA